MAALSNASRQYIHRRMLSSKGKQRLNLPIPKDVHWKIKYFAKAKGMTQEEVIVAMTELFFGQIPTADHDSMRQLSQQDLEAETAKKDSKTPQLF